MHWPFCQSKCPYCDFNSHITQNVDQERWLAAYLREIDRYAEEIPGRVINSIFFGGGTPSLMKPHIVAKIIERIRTRWPAANDLEISLEANPGSVEAERFRGYRDGGVNRISMGVQALNDRDLRRLGRLHTADEALAAFEIAKNTFDRVSFDLIYARQGQTLTEWEAELSRAIDLAVDHLSLYQLTIEQGTAFGDRYNRGKLGGLPNDDLAADMYLATQDMCNQAGYNCYEISNYARIGSESRHNLIYWRYGDYVGVGPGAHGRITVNGQRCATEAWSAPGKWLEQAEGKNAESVRSLLTGFEQADEYLMMGLRIEQGIDINRYNAISERDLNVNTIDRLVNLGMLDLRRHSMRVTNQGRMVLNAIIKEFLAD